MMRILFTLVYLKTLMKFLKTKLKFWKWVLVGTTAVAFVTFVSALTIETDLLNRVLTMTQIFVTSDGNAPDWSNELIILNGDNAGWVQFKALPEVATLDDDSLVLGVDRNGNLLQATSWALADYLSGLISWSWWVINTSWLTINDIDGLQEYLDAIDRDVTKIYNTDERPYTEEVTNYYATWGTTYEGTWVGSTTWVNFLVVDQNGSWFIINTGTLQDLVDIKFNINRTTTRNGIPSVNVWWSNEPNPNSTVVDFLEWYFFPDEVAVGTLNGGGTYELANPAGTTDVTINRSVTRKTNPVSSITLTSTNPSQSITIDTSWLDAYGNSKNGSQLFTMVNNIPSTFTLTITDSKGRKVTKTTSASRQNRVFRGKLADFVGVGNTEALALSNSQLMAWIGSFGTKSFPGNGFIYIAVPTRFSPSGASFVINGLPNNNRNRDTVINFTNGQGYTESYDIYRLNDATPDTLSVQMQ